MSQYLENKFFYKYDTCTYCHNACKNWRKIEDFCNYQLWNWILLQSLWKLAEYLYLSILKILSTYWHNTCKYWTGVKIQRIKIFFGFWKGMFRFGTLLLKRDLPSLFPWSCQRIPWTLWFLLFFLLFDWNYPWFFFRETWSFKKKKEKMFYYRMSKIRNVQKNWFKAKTKHIWPLFGKTKMCLSSKQFVCIFGCLFKKTL